MKRLKWTLVGSLSRVQRRAGVLMLLLALAASRPLWPQSVSSPAPPETLQARLAHVVATSAATDLGQAAVPAGEPGDRATTGAKTSRSVAHHLVSGLQLFGQKTYPFRWVSVSGSENARRAFRTQTSRTGGL